MSGRRREQNRRQLRAAPPLRSKFFAPRSCDALGSLSQASSCSAFPDISPMFLNEEEADALSRNSSGARWQLGCRSPTEPRSRQRWRQMSRGETFDSELSQLADAKQTPGSSASLSTSLSYVRDQLAVRQSLAWQAALQYLTRTKNDVHASMVYSMSKRCHKCRSEHWRPKARDAGPAAPYSAPPRGYAGTARRNQNGSLYAARSLRRLFIGSGASPSQRVMQLQS